LLQFSILAENNRHAMQVGPIGPLINVPLKREEKVAEDET